MSIESRSRQYGKVFDHWQIKEFLGQGSGGKSAVFRLTRSDSAWGTSALKVINLMEERGSFEELSSFRKSEYLAACEDCSSMAEQEVRLMDDLQGNTNIVDYLDHTFVDWSDEFGFGRDMLIRMELLKDLRGVIQRGHVFSEAEVLKVGKDICTALILCHRKNILHRDIKPENIFVNKDGNFKLGDFGVSRILSAAPMAMASTGIGTPEYAAPEQFSGHHDKRVDIYSLGLVLYELGNQNRLPFAESTYARQEDIRRRHMGEPLPAPCNVGDDFAKVILKACAHRAEDRYQTAAEFLKALNGIAKRLASERAATPKREDIKSAMRAEPTRSGFETQKAMYEEYMTTQAKPNQEEPAFDWDAYSTIMATAEEPTENTLQRGENTYHSKGRFETQKQPQRRKKQTAYIGWVVGASLLLMFVIGVLRAYIIGSAPKKESGETQTDLMSMPSIEMVTEVPTVEVTETTMMTVPPEEETIEAVAELEVTCKQSLYKTLDANTNDTIALKNDGTVVTAGGIASWHPDQLDNVRDWNDIVSVAAGGTFLAGLRSDGTVVAADYQFEEHKHDVSDWSNIIYIAAGGTHLAGLKSDGTVVAVGENDSGQCDVFAWKDIVAIGAGTRHTVGVKSDGTVIASGKNDDGQCNVGSWSDITDVSAGIGHTVGLRSDGTVVAVGLNHVGQCDVEQWSDIIAVAAGNYHTVGLKADGTVISTGQNEMQIGESNTPGQRACDVDNWNDIVAISAAAHTVGLKSDGSVVAVGMNHAGQCNVDSWNNIRIPQSAESVATTEEVAIQGEKLLVDDEWNDGAWDDGAIKVTARDDKHLSIRFTDGRRRHQKNNEWWINGFFGIPLDVSNKFETQYPAHFTLSNDNMEIAFVHKDLVAGETTVDIIDRHKFDDITVENLDYEMLITLPDAFRYSTYDLTEVKVYLPNAGGGPIKNRSFFTNAT